VAAGGGGGGLFMMPSPINTAEVMTQIVLPLHGVTPVDARPLLLDTRGGGIGREANTLFSGQALWHSSPSGKTNKTKKEREKKRKDKQGRLSIHPSLQPSIIHPSSLCRPQSSPGSGLCLMAVFYCRAEPSAFPAGRLPVLPGSFGLRALLICCLISADECLSVCVWVCVCVHVHVFFLGCVCVSVTSVRVRVAVNSLLRCGDFCSHISCGVFFLVVLVFFATCSLNSSSVVKNQADEDLLLQ